MKVIELKVKMPDEYFELLQSMVNDGGFNSIDELIVDRIACFLKFEKYYKELGKKDILSLIKT
ncbi:TPA: hypothetical protein RTH14_001681 [Campylobacter jejuni]|uniref:hypothetical protein n=1 Tax=Campylobacter jejuni TaxID=197 RepID=UPI000F80C7CB|nr:hypothetical protein [Campylobacter jejuni]EAL8917537.1 hypothetical protein [Campylobacter jejuni]ECL9136972.1 hypothetical protein [Campylobacter jejuni]EJF0794806.1 hypothetical protein [Campylobacter jejuni]EKG4104674.1 hypothetical protein [Campylobacter jejuni]EKG5498144.1 hypothetical protein [Campylobacter jejuni]